MKKQIIAATIFFAINAVGASAADLMVKARPSQQPAPTVTWTGCYVEGGGGYGWSSLNHTPTWDLTGQPVGPAPTSHGTGGFGTVGGGCDYQIDHWVIGGFTDFDWSNVRGEYRTSSFWNAGQVPAVTEMKQDWAWAIGARAGYLITPSFLAYVAGGYTAARFVQSADLVRAFFPDSPGGHSDIVFPGQTYSGFFVGLGGEYNIWSGLFLKSEYRYSRFQAKSFQERCTNLAVCFFDPVGISERVSPTVQSIRAELVWKFNWGGPVVAKY